MLVGDGVDVCKTGFTNMSNSVLLKHKDTPELIRYQTAYGVALAAVNKEHINAEDLEPFYLRASQAERSQSCNKLSN